MTLNKIYENIKKKHNTLCCENTWYFRRIIEISSFVIGFTFSILDYEKISQELLTPLMTPLKESGLFCYFYIIDIIETE